MIESGNIVTIIGEDLLFTGCQGKVEAIVDDSDEDGNVDVKIGSDGEYLLGHCTSEEEKIVRFKEDQLTVEEDWNVENKAINLFGKNMWHHLYSLKKPFSFENECMYKSCGEKCAKRIMVNIWGSVCEYDVCEEHAKEWHGKCADEFPC